MCESVGFCAKCGECGSNQTGRMKPQAADVDLLSLVEGGRNGQEPRDGSGSQRSIPLFQIEEIDTAVGRVDEQMIPHDAQQQNLCGDLSGGAVGVV